MAKNELIAKREEIKAEMVEAYKAKNFNHYLALQDAYDAIQQMILAAKN